jgi:ATP/maltotriose-dependent transcriptional regulator MalT
VTPPPPVHRLAAREACAAGRQRQHEPRPSLTLARGARRITFTCCTLQGPHGGRRLADRAARGDDAACIATMQAFGLTAREAEVLYWVAKGKTNRDIGDILGTSPPR